MGGRSAGGIFAGKIYRTWHCDSVFSGAGNGAYKSGDRILHGAKQCVAGADGVKQVLRRADLLAGMRDNGYTVQKLYGRYKRKNRYDHSRLHQ